MLGTDKHSVGNYDVPRYFDNGRCTGVFSFRALRYFGETQKDNRNDYAKRSDEVGASREKLWN